MQRCGGESAAARRQEKFSFSPGRGHSKDMSLPVEDSVT